MSAFIDNVGSYDANIMLHLNNHTPRYQPSDTIPNDGNIRINYGKFEYWDGRTGCWMPCGGADITVSLGPRLDYIVEWAERKMDEEKKLAEMVEKYPTLKAAKENYELIKAMVSNG
jgi:hypothetical protein